MMAKLFYFDLTKNISAKSFEIKNFERKLRHQVMEAEAINVEAEAIQNCLFTSLVLTNWPLLRW